MIRQASQAMAWSVAVHDEHQPLRVTGRPGRPTTRQSTSHLGHRALMAVDQSLALEGGAVELSQRDMVTHLVRVEPAVDQDGSRPGAGVACLAMDTARQAAPEVDRLVLSVNGQAGPLADERLGPEARLLGLDTLEWLPHLAGFLLAGRLTTDLALLRLRYAPRERVLSRLADWEQRGLVTSVGGHLAASPGFGTFLEQVQEVYGEVAARQWSEHDDDVDVASSTARLLADAATPAHVVAVVHRGLPEPDDPYLRLHRRLTTLRYVRQHDHAEAWLTHDLTPDEMKTMTDLWLTGKPDRPDGLAALIARGLAAADPARLTAAAQELRVGIETETNRRNQETFDILDEPAAEAFLASLRRLPGAV